MTGETENLHPDLVWKLNRLEALCGFELSINSGFRSPEKNADPKVKGVKNSAHLTREAVDIDTSTSAMRYKLVKIGLELGFNRIGIGKTFVHLDTSRELPQAVMWHYYPK